MSDAKIDRSCDKLGRPYARLSGLEPGDRLLTDADFTCMPAGAEREVKRGDDGELYIDCDDGGHALLGQMEADGDFLIGLYPVLNFEKIFARAAAQIVRAAAEEFGLALDIDAAIRFADIAIKTEEREMFRIGMMTEPPEGDESGEDAS